MNNILNTACEIQYFDTNKDFSFKALGNCILKYMKTTNFENCTPIILCIGTDRATGDCLGPLVGDMLMNYSDDFLVFGCLQEPVHALNLQDTIHHIKTEFKNPFVIAIDASLGSFDHIGYVTVSNCPIAPGKGVHKKLPEIGDVSITGIVNISGKNPHLLQNTRLNTVMQLAGCIADAMKYSIDCRSNFQATYESY